METVAQAGEQIAETAAETNNEEVGERVNPEGPREMVTDKGYHSKKVVNDLGEAGVRTYCAEPKRFSLEDANQRLAQLEARMRWRRA